jgi:hypothetical protein
MVKGIEIFRDHFAGNEHQYIIIGGAACDLLFGEAGLPFRATKDIDMVLCVEVVDAAFGEKFKAFLEAGGYQARERGGGKKEFYRFHKPTDANFPYMIELFSRKPGTLKLPENSGIIRVAVDDDLVSLSAILLDDDYYQALQSAKHMVDGVPVLDETVLIPFKAHAFLDLTDRAAKDEKIDEKNIKKHRNDVFRLLQLLPEEAKIEMPEKIRNDLRKFLDVIGKDQTIDPKAFDVPMSREEGMELLRSAYGLKA